MSVTTSTSCHISPHSFVVFQTSLPSPKYNIKTHSKSRSGSMSLATSSGPVRRVIARSFSVSTPSTSASWYPITPIPAHNSFEIYLDAQGTAHDPYFGELDLAASNRLMRLEYLRNSASDKFDPHEIHIATNAKTNLDDKENANANSTSNRENVVPANQPLPPRRTRERARTTRQDRQELTTISGSRSTPVGVKAGLGESVGVTERMRKLVDCEGAQGYPLVPRESQQKQQPQEDVKMNFWDAELAAKKELEEDDYSWYYRNPQRYVWRPWNTRKRMQRRKRAMCGIATGEEGAPTNKLLFASYLLQHYPSTLLLPPLGFEDEFPCESTGVKAGTRQHPNCASFNEKAPRYSSEDWQDDLFSPVENAPSRSRSHKCASCSLSMETFALSTLPGISAASSHHDNVLTKSWVPMNVDCTQFSFLRVLGS